MEISGLPPKALKLNFSSFSFSFFKQPYSCLPAYCFSKKTSHFAILRGTGTVVTAV